MNKSIKNAIVKEGLIIICFVLGWILLLLAEIHIFEIRAEYTDYTVLVAVIAYIGFSAGRFIIRAMRRFR